LIFCENVCSNYVWGFKKLSFSKKEAPTYNDPNLIEFIWPFLNEFACPVLLNYINSIIVNKMLQVESVSIGNSFVDE